MFVCNADVLTGTRSHDVDSCDWPSIVYSTRQKAVFTLGGRGGYRGRIARCDLHRLCSDIIDLSRQSAGLCVNQHEHLLLKNTRQPIRRQNAGWLAAKWDCCVARRLARMFYGWMVLQARWSQPSQDLRIQGVRYERLFSRKPFATFSHRQKQPRIYYIHYSFMYKVCLHIQVYTW